MKIIFVSNIMTPHQAYFSEQLYKCTDGNYKFIETYSTPKHSVPEGWRDEKEYELLVPNKMFRANFLIYKQEIFDADAVIIGSADDSLIKERLKANKLTFKYSERFYKGGFSAKNYIRNALAAYKHHGKYKNKPLYLLCASAYTAADAAKFGNYKNKCYKWGYFPKTMHYDDVNDLLSKKTRNSILWTGRFIEWKHPELAVLLAKKLKDEGFNFELNMIGGGELENHIKDMIKKLNLENTVKLAGTMPPKAVRLAMEKSSIFIGTSDFHEGWGAVLNEALNSACAVVSSHAAGSTPYLVKDGENGFVFKSGDLDDLYKKVKYLLENPDTANDFGLKAYNTITGLWNEKEAARRLTEFTKVLLSGEKYPDIYNNGPLSRAEILPNDWYK